MRLKRTITVATIWYGLKKIAKRNKGLAVLAVLLLIVGFLAYVFISTMIGMLQIRR